MTQPVSDGSGNRCRSTWHSHSAADYGFSSVVRQRYQLAMVW
jgi:hypothetical protein